MRRFHFVCIFLKGQHLRVLQVSIIMYVYTHLCACMYVCVCVCVCTSVCTCRVDNSVPEMSAVTGTVLVDSHGQHQMLNDDHTYSNVDDMKQRMFVVSGNPAYIASFDHSQQPVQQDDHAYYNFEFCQEQESVARELQAHGAAPMREAAIAK